jgi:hypothetical protein
VTSRTRPCTAVCWPAALATFTLAVILVAGGGRDATAQDPSVGCPPAGDPPSCTVFAEPIGSDVNSLGFTPRSIVRFEVFEGSTRVAGPIRARSNDFGNADGDLGAQRPPLNLQPGHIVVATDESTGTVKRHEVSPLRLGRVDLAANTVSGTAKAGERVRVLLDPPHDQAFGGRARREAVADSAGGWSVGFSEDITEQSRIDVYAVDADGDRTGLRPIGCPPVPGRLNCIVDVHLDGDFIFAAMAAGSKVRIQVFSSPGGSSRYGPITGTTDDVGEMVPGLEPAFEAGLDMAPGLHVVATDLKSNTVKRLDLPPLFIDRVDPETDVVEGRAPADATVYVDIREGFSQQVRADAGGNWRVDFRALAFDVTYDDAAVASVLDSDGDVASAERGAPLLDCVQDADTVCGTAGTETLELPEGAPGAGRLVAAASSTREVKAGGGRDTVLVGAGGSAKKVEVDTGTGKVDKVVVRPGTGTARPKVVIAGKSRRLVVVLPADAGRLIATVTGTKGADKVYTRSFRASAGSDGGYRIAGGRGNDSLRGGNGRDTLNGGAGRDTCYVGKGDTVKSCEAIRRI